MRLRIDTAEVELRTKIRAKYVRAMENEEWDLLPGEVYVRSFLRTYADFLGLDSRQLLDDYRRRYERPADHEPPPIVPPSRERRDRERRRRQGGGLRVPPWAAVVVVLVIVGVVLYVVGKHGPTGNATNAAIPPTTHTHTTHSHRVRHRPRHVHHAPAAPKSVTLALSATSSGGTWVCLVNGSGKALINGQTFTTGQTIPTETAHKLLLTLGNASVTIKADGATVPVAASPGPIGFRFTPAGHVALSSAQRPTCS